MSKFLHDDDDDDADADDTRAMTIPSSKTAELINLLVKHTHMPSLTKSLNKTYIMLKKIQ